MISKIDFNAENLTSNVGLFLLLENAKSNGIFDLIENDQSKAIGRYAAINNDKRQENDHGKTNSNTASNSTGAVGSACGM